ncbi:chorismate synthase [Bacteroidota bacterium]
MSGNSFGTLFRITTFGESHGPMIGVVIDGCPAGLKLDFDQIRSELKRRRPGQNELTTSRNETDDFEIVSGILDGYTTGTPITILISNRDQRSGDYDIYKDVFRPSHADYTYHMKYGLFDHRGGGRSSARETVARVAAGAIARQFLDTYGIGFKAYVSQVGNHELLTGYHNLNLNNIDSSVVRCPDFEISKRMISAIKEAQESGDSLGGKICCVITNCPVGLGEPVYDRLEADLAKAMLSINASKAFEIGSGFASAGMKGSEYKDQMKAGDNSVVFESNHAGGVLGGISTGQDVYFNVAFKPTSSIIQSKDYVTKDFEQVTLENKHGRHDPCVVPRAVPIVEAMAALVIADHILRHRSSKVS